MDHKQIYPIPNENKRIFCAYHETQFLTNFCQQKQCLMPLCPSCISEHTQEHFQQEKKPIYLNINDALNKAKQKCYCTIVSMQEYKGINEDIFQYIINLQNTIRLQLQQCKGEIFAVINQKFHQYQERLIEQIVTEYKQKNVYDKDQAVNASKFIDEEICNLYDRITSLKGDDCLSTLITYKAVDQQGYIEALQQFNDYVDKNHKAGKLQITLIEEKLSSITADMCDNLLCVESVIPLFKKPHNQAEDATNKSKRYGFNKSSRIKEKQNVQGNLSSSRNKKEKLNVVGSGTNSNRQISFNTQGRQPQDHIKFREQAYIKQDAYNYSKRPGIFSNRRDDLHNDYMGSPRRLTRKFRR